MRITHLQAKLKIRYLSTDELKELEINETLVERPETDTYYDLSSKLYPTPRGLAFPLDHFAIFLILHVRHDAESNDVVVAQQHIEVDGEISAQHRIEDSTYLFGHVSIADPTGIAINEHADVHLS